MTPLHGNGLAQTMRVAIRMVNAVLRWLPQRQMEIRTVGNTLLIVLFVHEGLSSINGLANTFLQFQ